MRHGISMAAAAVAALMLPEFVVKRRARSSAEWEASDHARQMRMAREKRDMKRRERNAEAAKNAAEVSARRRAHNEAFVKARAEKDRAKRAKKEMAHAA